MNDIVNLILNSSVSIVVIAYFMYRDFKFMSTLEKTLQTLTDTTNLIKDYFITQERIEDDGK